MDGLVQTNCPDLELLSRGKVRDIFRVPEDPNALLFVATDRVSAFDVVMKNGIPSKGKLLTKLSEFWFKLLNVPNHMINSDIKKMPKSIQKYKEQLDGRCMLVRKCEVLPIEAIVRGYLTGSAWKEYAEKATVHGMTDIKQGLVESSKFPEPLFTPSTKAEIGDHDENISPEQMKSILPRPELGDIIAKKAVEIFNTASKHAEEVGLILADTKFEFGLLDGEVILIDEVLTPDSSRFWLADEWSEGKRMTGLDKQYFREWLKGPDSEWDGKSALTIPPKVVSGTWKAYKEAYKRITGEEWTD